MQLYSPDLRYEMKIPFALSPVCAGFPSPASDYMDKILDLNELIVKNPTATFFARCSGDSMNGVGIFNGDILVIDRSVEAKNGNIIVAIMDGENTVKRLSIQNEKIILVAENEDYEDIIVKSESDFEIWGVVTAVIHLFKNA